MTAAAIPDFIESREARLERLTTYEQRFKTGWREQIETLWRINQELLFKDAGFDNIVDYCKAKLDIKKSRCYQLLKMSETIQALGESTIVESLTHEGLVRDISGMAPKSRARVITEAAKVSQKKGIPLTGKLVLAVAKERNPKWKSNAEFKADKKAKAAIAKEASPELKFSTLREDFENAFAVLLDYGLTAPQLVKRLGDPKLLVGFADVRDLLNDMLEAAP